MNFDVIEAWAKAGDFARVNDAIAPLDENAKKEAVDHWNSVGKPVNSLGVLETLIVQIAGLKGTAKVDLGKRAALPLCADNGVVEEGVSQSGPEVTSIVAANMARGTSSVCVMGRLSGVVCHPVDVGMLYDAEGVLDRKIARGTNNFTKGPAMSREQACQALAVGIECVHDLASQGYGIILSGEMGIGNTTTSSALATVLLGKQVEDVTGRGAGLSDTGLACKIDAIKRAIALNEPDPNDALDCLAKVGGFDIAAMAGAFIGGALYRVPVVIDGLISAIAALVAARLCPASRCAMMASHSSFEPAAETVLDELGVRPIIFADLRLGEGTGAACLIPLLDMALTVYDGLSFDEIGVEQYDVEVAPQ